MKRFTATALALIMTACLLEAKEGDGQDVNETSSLTHELMRFAGNSFTLPKSEVRGLVMQAEVLGHESIMLHVDCTPDMTGEMLGVALTCRGELNVSAAGITASGVPYILNQNW